MQEIMSNMYNNMKVKHIWVYPFFTSGWFSEMDCLKISCLFDLGLTWVKNKFFFFDKSVVYIKKAQI
jgi:hypothetical protein